MDDLLNRFATFLLVNLHLESSKSEILDLSVHNGRLVSPTLSFESLDLLVLLSGYGFDDNLNQRELLSDSSLEVVSEGSVFRLIMLGGGVVLLAIDTIIMAVRPNITLTSAQ
jgi:hypothetical protein